jgi:putative transposase
MDITVLRTQSHSAFRLDYHLVLTVKYRHKCITASMLARLEDITRDLLTKWRCHPIEFNGEADHVHLLIEAHPALDLSRLVGNLKAVTARRMRAEYAQHLQQYFWKPHFWNRAYAIISAGTHANLETLVRSIQDQDTPPARPHTDDQP